MGSWLIDLPRLFIWVGACSLFFIFAGGSILFARQDSTDAKKIQENKALLKQLLEGFGLELPAELREPDNVAFKTRKNH